MNLLEELMKPKGIIVLMMSLLGLGVIITSIIFKPLDANYLIYQHFRQWFQIITLGTTFLVSLLFYRRSSIIEFLFYSIANLGWFIRSFLDYLSIVIHSDKDVWMPIPEMFFLLFLTFWIPIISRFQSLKVRRITIPIAALFLITTYFLEFGILISGESIDRALIQPHLN